MGFMLFGALLYFLPAIIGHNKQAATGIFLVNFFFGWTVIGWLIAFVWACSSEHRAPMMVVAGPGKVCYCGQVSHLGARYCATCGRAI